MGSDYIDFVCHHGDDASKRSLVQRWSLRCESITRCAWTQRHLRPEGQRERGNDKLRHATVDRLDVLHFNVLHLHDAGLRLPDGIEDGQDPENSDKRKTELIQAKRAAFTNQRYNGDKNGKFNLAVDVKRLSADGGKCRIHFIHLSLISHMYADNKTYL